MSLDTLNNGDSGLVARTKINAAIAAVNAGVGAANGMADFAFVNWVTGNNATAMLGYPSKPFKNAAAAIAAALSFLKPGLAKIYLQTAVPELPTISSHVTELHVYGDTVETSTIQGFAFTAGDSAVTVIGNGRNRVQLGFVSLVGAAGVDGVDATSPGGNGGNGGSGGDSGMLTICDAAVTLASSNGGNGGNGGLAGDGDESFYNGGDAGSGGHGGSSGGMRLSNCALSSNAYSTYGGNGGTASNAGYPFTGDYDSGTQGVDTTGGDGGQGGPMFIEHCVQSPGSSPPSLQLGGGAGGAGVMAAGGNGDGGVLQVAWSDIGDAAGYSGAHVRASCFSNDWVVNTDL